MSAVTARAVGAGLRGGLTTRPQRATSSSGRVPLGRAARRNLRVCAEFNGGISNLSLSETHAALVEQQELRRKAESKIGAERQAAAALKAEATKLRSEISNLKGDLSSLSFKLQQERTVSREKEEAIQMLKHELNKSIDSFEGEQDKTKKMSMEMHVIQRELSNVRSQKQKSDERVEVLQERIHNAEARARQYSSDLQAERENKSDSNEAVEKLQHVITTLKHEKDAAVHAVNSVQVELGQEKHLREQAETAVLTMRSQLESMRANAEARAAEAQKALSGFRSEMSTLRSRSQEALTTVQDKQANLNKLRLEIAALKEAQDMEVDEEAVVKA
eukprot:CAMPEP_0117674338 /NCGR_PEP_ID=MMETSP0804-20121206/14981_1 /TAXON_ID=1074897 /ORGANISM="Tetraselmis astigmatica, Strain CCMP880" /LENGTH=331 /DNA_ID=CAMNT_0005483193 /DNA_START=617 /DNA_END=1612 /DNA_ORIENTATION=+